MPEVVEEHAVGLQVDLVQHARVAVDVQSPSATWIGQVTNLHKAKQAIELAQDAP